MYLRYSNFAFSTGEAFPSFFRQIRRYNQRGRAQSIIKTVQVQGEVIATSQAGCESRVAQILTALELEGGSVDWIDDTGQQTHISLPSVGSYGVRILENTLTMEEAKAHWATGVPFQVTFEAEYGISDGDRYVFYQETIGKIGNGGPRIVIQELDNGPPIEQIVSTHTPVQMVQQGTAVGARAYPPFPVPIFGCDSTEQVQFYDTPEVNGLVYENYPIRWSYRKTLNTAPSLVPPNFPG